MIKKTINMKVNIAVEDYKKYPLTGYKESEIRILSHMMKQAFNDYVKAAASLKSILED